MKSSFRSSRGWRISTGLLNGQHAHRIAYHRAACRASVITLCNPRAGFPQPPYGSGLPPHRPGVIFAISVALFARHFAAKRAARRVIRTIREFIGGAACRLFRSRTLGLASPLETSYPTLNNFGSFIQARRNLPNCLLHASAHVASVATCSRSMLRLRGVRP